MDFGLSAEQRALQRDLRAFFAEQEVRELLDAAEVAPGTSHDALRELYRRIGQRRWLAVDWPREYGGLGATPLEAALVAEEMGRHGMPDTLRVNTIENVGGCLLAAGTPEQRALHLPPMARGERFVAVLLSEPAAGSDLGALTTSAVATGAGWEVHGTKLWSAYAQLAAFGLCAVRTGEGASRYDGITLMLIPLDALGVRLRALETVNPEPLYEVVLDGVRVGADMVVGPVGGGWALLTAALTAERTGIGYQARGRRLLGLLGRAARPGGRRPDGWLAGRLAGLDADLRACRLLAWQVARQAAAGRPDASATAGAATATAGAAIAAATAAAVAKWHASETARRVVRLGLEQEGPAATLDPDDGYAPLGGRLAVAWREAPGWTLAAGTSEMMLRQIAQALVDAGPDAIDPDLRLDRRQQELLGAFRRFTAGAGRTPSWQAFARRGWAGLTVPAAAGGMGLGQAEAVLLARQLGSVLWPSSWLDAATAADLLLAAGPERPRVGIVPGIAAGTCRVALALTGDAAGLPVLDASGRRLSGACPLMAGAADASHLLLLAHGGAGPVLLALAAGREGISRSHQRGLARSELFLVRFDAMPVDDDDVVGPPGDLLPAAVAGARLRQAAYLVGLCRSALALAVDRVGAREQFGAPLASFQAVSFPLAALAARLAGAWLLVAETAWRADRGGDVRPAAAQALAACGELALDLTARTIQVHGAAGLTAEAEVERYYRHAAVDATRLGSPSRLRVEAADLAAGPARRQRPAPRPAGRPRTAVTAGAAAPLPADPCLHLLVEAQSARTPDAVAVVFESRRLTYRELDRLAGLLARRLGGLGVGPDVPVGVCLERSPELVVALLAVLKAGGAYLPLDPEYPPERLAFMLRDAGAPVVLTEEWMAEWLPATGARLVCLAGADDVRADDVPAEAGGFGAGQVRGEHLAYVMYTSGSTGRPKGVMVTHRGIANRLLWEAAAHPLSEADAVLQRTSPGFDISVWEIFMPLVCGARLVMARPGGHRDPAYLVDLIARERVTTIGLVPSVLELLLDQDPGLSTCHSLRQVFSGGEALPPALQERFLDQVKARLYNCYGPTEVAIDATMWECRPDPDAESVPIGHPIGNVRAYVLGDGLQPVPIGVDGELFVAGPGVARGYLGQPGLTAERFLPDPLGAVPGERMYRTGDRARVRADGAIEYLGRLDDQVKVRGHRVEPAEIERILEQHPDVEQAVVTADHGAGVTTLEAWALVRRRPAPPAGELRGFLARRLPAHLVPAGVTVLDRLPRTPTGKVDRAALARCGPGRPVAAPAAAGNASLEERVAALFSRVLRRPTVPPTASFFDLGGDSLLAARLVTLARDELGLPVSLQSLFEAPTAAGWADRLGGDQAGGGGS